MFSIYEVLVISGIGKRIMNCGRSIEGDLGDNFKDRVRGGLSCEILVRLVGWRKGVRRFIIKTFYILRFRDWEGLRGIY